MIVKTYTHQKTIHFEGKKYTLPTKLHFEKLHRCFRYDYKVIGYRKPLSGEYYVSGAVPEAYRACCDLSVPFLIVEPIQSEKGSNKLLSVEHIQ